VSAAASICFKESYLFVRNKMMTHFLNFALVNFSEVSECVINEKF
jgi:hypothetical protein